MTEIERGPSVRWLTATAWAALLVFATTTTLTSVSLEEIGTDLNIGFDLKGLLSGLRSAALAVTVVVIGYAADRSGKRWFLSAGMLIMALGLLWIGRCGSYVGLAGGLMTLAMGLGCVEALASPLVADLHPERVETQMNVLHAFFPIGIALVAPLLGWAIDKGMPWRLPYTIAAVPAALVGVMFVIGGYPAPDRPQHASPFSARRVLRMPMFWLLAAAMLLTAGAEGALLAWAPSFIRRAYGASAAEGAWGLAVFAAAMAIGRLATGLAARWVPLSRIMLALIFVCAASTLVLVMVDSMWVSIASLLLAGLAIACFWPSILTVATRRIASGSATLLAMMAVAGIAGFGIIPWAVGQVAEAHDLRVGLGIVPVTLVVAGAALIIVFRIDGGAHGGHPPAGAGQAG